MPSAWPDGIIPAITERIGLNLCYEEKTSVLRQSDSSHEPQRDFLIIGRFL